MDPEFERKTLLVEERSWWYRGRREIVRQAIAALDLPHHASILDAGCGSGRNMVEFASFGRVTGVDVSEYSVEAARARGLEDVRVAGLNALPFEDASFDLVTTLDVIEHIDDDVAALREMRRVARPDGRLLVTVPAYPALWSSHDELNHHRRRYTRETLLAAVERAGWEPLRTTFFNSLLLPVAAAYRLAERWGLTPPAQTSAGHEAQLELGTSWMNGLLERILLTEAEVIAGGRRRLPAGLSLMAIMRPARPIAGGQVGRRPAMDRAPSAERKAADRVQGS